MSVYSVYGEVIFYLKPEILSLSLSLSLSLTLAAFKANAMGNQTGKPPLAFSHLYCLSEFHCQQQMSKEKNRLNHLSFELQENVRQKLQFLINNQ